MLFGQQGTEPTYAGLRMPRQRVEDDARLIRQGNPQERFRDYHAELPPLTETEKVAIQGDPMEAPNSRLMETPEKKAENKKKMQAAISGIGGDLAQMFAQSQQPTQPLQFAQLQQQQLTPLIDPRFLRYAGGRKDGGPIKRGSWAKVHKGEAVIATPDGDTVVVPKGQVKDLEDEVLPNEQIPTKGRRAVNWDVKGTAEQPVTTNDVKEEAVLEQTVTPNSVTETVTEEPSIADVLRAKIEERQKRLAEGATKNEDGTTMYGGKKYRKRNAFDALKSAGLGVLQSLATAQVNPNDPNPLSSMLGRAIGGAAAGGVMGATMNNVDERMMDKMKIAQLTPQYEQASKQEEDTLNKRYKQAQITELRRRPTKEQETRDQQTRLQELKGRQAVDRINRNADIKSGVAKPVINESGYIELEYLNADSSGKRRENELLKGADGQPIFVPGEQGLTWIDPLTNKPMQVKAKQTLMPGATIATGNATRSTAADRDNAEKFWQTQKENISNQMKWLSDVKALTTAAITADSGMVDDLGTRAEMDGKLKEITALSNSPLPDGLDTDGLNKAQETKVKRINQLVDDYNTLNNKLLDNLGKSAAGKAKADQIRTQIKSMPAPPKLTYTPYKPTMVTGGLGGRYAGQSFPSPEALQKAFPGKSPADIKAIVEGQGGRFVN